MMTDSKFSRKLISTVAVLAISVFVMFALTGCFGDPYAAKVNGVEIKESKITKQIETVRKSYSLTDNDSWGQYLASASMTPSSLRDQVLDSYIQQEIVKQYAGEKDAEATDDQINEQIEKVKGYYDSDDAWNTALENAGFENEDGYRDILKYSIAYQNLEDKFAEEATIDDDKLLEDVKTKAETINGGKKSSHILFNSDDEETAKEVLEKIKSGELDFAEAAKEYSQDTSSAEEGGNVGWDKETSFVEAYTNALNNLSEGQISDLVTSDYGIHIIKCTGVFNMPANTDSLSDFPESVIEDVRESDKETQGSSDLTSWIDEKKESANIEKKDMPSNVSYNIDMSKYSTSDDSSTDDSTDTTDSTDTIESTESMESTESTESAESAESAESTESTEATAESESTTEETATTE